ncbi:oligoendopeptidase F, partial [bacterium F16]
MAVKDRADVPDDDRWDLTGLYSDEMAWETEFAALETHCTPQLCLKGTLGDYSDNLAECLRQQDELNRILEQLSTYAARRSDEDTANTHCMGLLDRIRKEYVQISATLSWIRPEILAIQEDTLNHFISTPVMEPHRRTMELLLRDKPYSLSDKEERLLALAGEPLESSGRTFGVLNNADLRFPDVSDESGQAVELTHGNYSVFLESNKREVRKQAFNAMFSTYDSLKNTLCSTLSGSVNKHVFYAQARGHESAIKASLHRDNVDISVYDSLIDAVHNALPIFHRYLSLRKRQLKLETLDMYDLYVPIVPDFSINVSFDEAFEWIVEAVAPLGTAYQDVLKRALDERWIDRFENRGKRSGAYSGGCYGSNPFILMNYQNSINSAFTLAHELGHSMHSYLSNLNQAHNQSQYTIFVAEVASTLNECLLFEYLMEKTDDPQFKAYLLNQKCEGFKGTVFRQTMFAEFEKTIYEMAEHGVPLTADSLCDAYVGLNDLYYGKDVVPDPLIRM